MTKEERAAYTVLASLYPDKKPSEVRKIIEKALEKDVDPDDVELWSILMKQKAGDEPETEVVREKIIEHHYHDRYPYYTLTCGDSITVSGTSFSCSGETRDSVFCTSGSVTNDSVTLTL